MTFVICEPCIGTKDTACVEACPVDCIHPRKDEEKFESEEQLYIDPEECIDCGACVPECPVEAIFPEDGSSGSLVKIYRHQLQMVREQEGTGRIFLSKMDAHVNDTLGRPLRDLRISVTDRCNFRCVYCMPKEIFGRGLPVPEAR